MCVPLWMWGAGGDEEVEVEVVNTAGEDGKDEEEEAARASILASTLASI